MTHEHERKNMTFGEYGKQLGLIASLERYTAEQFKALRQQRRVTAEELTALLGAREMMVRGLIKDGDGVEDARDIADSEHLFNMNRTCSTFRCASVACIGGTMGLIMGYDVETAHDYVTWANADDRAEAPLASHSDSLSELFFPHSLIRVVPEDWENITTEQAVKAIDNWLNNGNPNWNGACGR